MKCVVVICVNVQEMILLIQEGTNLRRSESIKSNLYFWLVEVLLVNFNKRLVNFLKIYLGLTIQNKVFYSNHN